MNARVKILILPACLKEKIEALGLTGWSVLSAYRMVYLLILRAIRKKAPLHQFHPLPTSYLQKVFGSRYNTVLSPLKQAGVLQPYLNPGGVEVYHNGKCKHYRINAEYLKEPLISVAYKGPMQLATAKFINIRGEPWAKTIIEDDMSKLHLPLSALHQAIETHKEGIGSTLLYGAEITRSGFEVENRKTQKVYRTSLSKALQKAALYQATLIQDGNKFIIEDRDTYIAAKKWNISLSYQFMVALLEANQYYVARNKTNHRLDHNYTSLSKVLLEVIKQSNDLVEIDLANSQFAILSYLMHHDRAFESTVDFEVFSEVTANGTLYEYIKAHFGLTTRAAAKTMMMELAFSHPHTTSPEKQRLKDLFPSVVGYIDNYKREKINQLGKKGHKRFAVWLQQTEADLFIDHLYYQLKKQGFWVLTRHDSLLVRATDAGAVKSRMQQYFQSIGFYCSLK